MPIKRKKKSLVILSGTKSKNGAYASVISLGVLKGDILAMRRKPVPYLIQSISS